MTALTRGDASLATEGLGWRYLLQCLTTSVPVQSLKQAGKVIDIAVSAGGSDVDDHLRLHAARGHVELTLQTIGERNVTSRDVDIARRITHVLRAAGLTPTHRTAGRSVHSIEIAIDAMEIVSVRPFWKAVLDYQDAPGHGSGELVDPAGGGLSVWFQQMDTPRRQRNRIHFDVTVPHDEVDSRVEAALDAGGHLVSADRARAFWILADAEGNEVCLCTWQDRD